MVISMLFFIICLLMICKHYCGGHAYSVDGVNWIYGGASFGNTVQFTDNTNVTFSRRERLHFVFADDKSTPIALTNGVQYGGEYGDAKPTHP